MTNAGLSSLGEEQPFVRDWRETASRGIAANGGDRWLAEPSVG